MAEMEHRHHCLPIPEEAGGTGEAGGDHRRVPAARRRRHQRSHGKSDDRRQPSLPWDQLIRGVQTFRDPATGGTFELSNKYDHAWFNGANEYVMSDDPNFHPNGKLNGNWNQLEVV